MPDDAHENRISQMFMAYVSNNNLDPSRVENVVRTIRRALSGDSELATGKAPAVPIAESIRLIT